MTQLTQSQINTYWWILGHAAFQALERGDIGAAVAAIRRGRELGVFEDAGSWRTAVLVNCDLGGKGAG